MTAYILRRIAQIVPVVLGITIVTFALVRLTGDPAAILLPSEATAEARQAFRAEFGLDDPLPVQYLRFVGNALRGDFGRSIRYREPVMNLFIERLPASFQLSATAMALAIVVGLPIGVLSAVKRNSLIDHVARVGSLVGQAVPSFYLALLMIMVFGVQLRWFPTSGYGEPIQLVMPAVALGVFLVALLARFTRGAVLDVLRQDFVRTARAKGLGETIILNRHVLRNALIPVITVIGLQVGGLFSGAVVVETVFAWPGIGRLIVQAIQSRDFPIVQATVMIVSVAFVVVNLAVDLAYAWIDPRIRYS